MPSTDPPVILFDGVCNLCNWSVRFIIKHDTQAIFRFCAQQSPIGQRLLEQHAIDNGLRSIVLIQDGRALLESDAVLHIGRQLPRLRMLSGLALQIPRWLRDRIYRLLARYRYRLFGREESCMVPTPALRDRFL